MRNVSVEVLEDASRPEGGHAVILLHGVESLPDGATFRIKPVDMRGGHEKAGARAWPQGEQRPVAIRRMDAGIAVLVGPDIVECAALLPGTLGVVELHAAGIRGEFLWPSIRPTARPRRRNLTVVKPQATRATTLAPVFAKIAEANAATPTAVSVQIEEGAAVEPLAAKSSARLKRDVAGGDRRKQAEPAADVAVPVTALDHAVPATATVAEAIGANVVQLSIVRDGDGAASSNEARANESGASRVHHIETKAAAAVASPDQALPAKSGVGSFRIAGIAASLALIVSGGFLLLGQQPDFIGRATIAKRDTANVVLRAEALPRQEAEAPALVEVTRPEPKAVPPAPEAAAPVAPQRIAAAELATPPAVLPAVAAPQPRQEVTLRMRGGGFQITGELKAFDGAKYIIETRAAGTLAMDASRFECLGEACGRPAVAILPLSERPSPVKPDVFRIEGAPSLAAEFVPQLIRDYAQVIGASASELPREPGQAAARFRLADTRGIELATIEVHATGTAAALTAIERGTATLALADRALGPELEQRPQSAPRGRPAAQQREAAPVQPSEVVIGLDGIAVVGSPAGAPASMSLDNLAKVLAGQLTDWYELGGTPGAIQLYLPPDGSATLDTVVRQLLRPRGLETSRAARRMASDTEAANAAARDPRGLAVFAFATQPSAKPVNLETACGLVVRPTAFAVKTGEYPLLRRLSMHAPKEVLQPSARGLMRTALSGDIGHAIAAARLIDPAIASLPIEEQAERMAWAANAPPAAFDAGELRQMLVDLEGATRLSVTFRYHAGTNDLDQRSRREVARLAAAMKEPELAGRRIVLAGFTDAGGKFQANKSVGLKRAGQIRAALLAAAGPGLDPRLVVAKSYGPLAPVGCSGTPDGARLNRRVEVWVTK